MAGRARAEPPERGRRACRGPLDGPQQRAGRASGQGQALEALRQQVPACSQCRPDTMLGFLE
ncbi:DUF6233 domain-containing protein [Streptomyces cyslabdanicus]|uniref:DUF6233 domain-containing protein n=1 Tax=Streptomyces cyslabdanicus TaxID=1470456 RepID=UPI004044577E